MEQFLMEGDFNDKKMPLGLCAFPRVYLEFFSIFSNKSVFLQVQEESRKLLVLILIKMRPEESGVVGSWSSFSLRKLSKYFLV